MRNWCGNCSKTVSCHLRASEGPRADGCPEWVYRNREEQPRRKPEPWRMPGVDTSGNLKRVMAEKGVTIGELCGRTGLSTATVWHLRRDNGSGMLWTWAAVASALGVSIDDLVHGDNA